MKAGALRRPPAAFAGDQLKSRGEGADDDRLDHSGGADGLSELFEALFAKSRAGLVRVRINEVNIDLSRA